MQRKLVYSLANIKDCEDQDSKKILSFTIRTTDGTDEAWAARRADSKGTGMTEELIRFSLVSYKFADDQGETKLHVITHPFEGFDKWSTKARNFVVAAWKKLSTPDEADLADFFASATEAE